MATVVLVIHLMIAVALVAVVLLQKSEGGALGMGGGGSGGGGFLTGRGTANLLTRTTAALAGCFFMTSILLTIIANNSDRAGSVFDRNSGTTTEQSAPAEGTGAPETGGSLLDSLKLDSPAPLPSSPQN
ncbi:MAG: preprotein translocase subunit SecG [Pseudomonadota bacterium]